MSSREAGLEIGRVMADHARITCRARDWRVVTRQRRIDPREPGIRLGPGPVAVDARRSPARSDRRSQSRENVAAISAWVTRRGPSVPGRVLGEAQEVEHAARLDHRGEARRVDRAIGVREGVEAAHVDDRPERRLEPIDLRRAPARRRRGSRRAARGREPCRARARSPSARCRRPSPRGPSWAAIRACSPEPQPTSRTGSSSSPASATRRIAGWGARCPTAAVPRW